MSASFYICIVIAAEDRTIVFYTDTACIGAAYAAACNSDIHDKSVILIEQTYISAAADGDVLDNMTVAAEFACECTDRRPYKTVKVDIVHQNIVAVKVIIDSLKLGCCGDGGVCRPVIRAAVEVIRSAVVIAEAVGI